MPAATGQKKRKRPSEAVKAATTPATATTAAGPSPSSSAAPAPQLAPQPSTSPARAFDELFFAPPTDKGREARQQQERRQSIRSPPADAAELAAAVAAVGVAETPSLPPSAAAAVAAAPAFKEKTTPSVPQKATEDHAAFIAKSPATKVREGFVFLFSSFSQKAGQRKKTQKKLTHKPSPLAKLSSRNPPLLHRLPPRPPWPRSPRS